MAVRPVRQARLQRPSEEHRAVAPDHISSVTYIRNGRCHVRRTAAAAAAALEGGEPVASVAATTTDVAATAATTAATAGRRRRPVTVIAVDPIGRTRGTTAVRAEPGAERTHAPNSTGLWVDPTHTPGAAQPFETVPGAVAAASAAATGNDQLRAGGGVDHRTAAAAKAAVLGLVGTRDSMRTASPPTEAGVDIPRAAGPHA